MPYELEGTVKVIMPQQTFGSGFTKREFVVTTASDRFPQEIKLECLKDKTALLDNVRTGDKVKVTFDLRGGEHNGRYFVNLVAWRIDSGEGGGSSSGGSGDTADYRPSAPRQDRPRPSGGGGGGGAKREWEPRGGGGGGGGGKRDWEDRGGGGGGGGGGGKRDWEDRGGDRRGNRGPRDEDFRGGKRGGFEEDDIDF